MDLELKRTIYDLKLQIKLLKTENKELRLKCQKDHKNDFFMANDQIDDIKKKYGRYEKFSLNNLENLQKENAEDFDSENLKVQNSFFIFNL